MTHYHVVTPAVIETHETREGAIADLQGYLREEGLPPSEDGLWAPLPGGEAIEVVECREED